MKKVLITGAAGAVGLNLVKYLLSEGKYEITALDLKNKNTYKKLKKYRKRITIIYGDILDRNLIEPLIKENDILFHLATVLPPLSEYKQELSLLIDYNGTENIVRAINYYNPKCYLVYGSTTSLCSKNSKDSYYANYKTDSEKLIEKKLNNYTIARLPLLLTDLKNDNFIYNVKRHEKVEVLTKDDAAYALCKIITKQEKLNKKIINLGGGEEMTCEYREILYSILKYYGVTWKFVLSYLFGYKNFKSPVLKDSDETNEMLSYRNESLSSYYMYLKRKGKNRKIQILLGKLFILTLKR